MSWAGVYFFLALLSVYCTLTAIVQARRCTGLCPCIFSAAWLCGELALIHLIWQVALTALVAFQAAFSDPLAQTGLGFLPCPGWALFTCTASLWILRTTWAPPCAVRWVRIIGPAFR